MAEKVASLYAELNLEDNMTPGLKKARGEADKFGDKIKNVGKNVTSLGKDMVGLSAPFVGGIGLAVKAAMDFDEQITNIASVMLMGRDEADAMGQAMLEMSRNTKFSATELAGAMYDVVGGVSDASQHMDILAAGAKLAEANNANLDGSIGALIASMNAYSSANVEASRVSDVLTATVRDGVGTMDELAAVFGRTSTLASPLGIDIEELGLLFAELSKRGATFQQAGTYIEGALSALINPTKELSDAFEEMGMTQADVLAMLESEGLTAVIQKMVDAGVDLTAVFGNKEALLGVLSIAEIDSSRVQEFTGSLDGLTDATLAVAAGADKFKWDTLVGDFSDLAVVVGQTLAPAFGAILDDLSPIVQSFADWAKQNPETITQLAGLALGVMALGAVLTPVGWVISGFGTILSGAVVVGLNAATIATWALNAAVAVLTSPITLTVGAIAGLLAILGSGEGGLVGGFMRAVTAARQLVELGIYFVTGALAELSNSPLFVAIRTAFETAFNAIQGIVEGVINAISGFLGGVQRTIEDVLIGLGLMEQRANASAGYLKQTISNAIDWANQAVENAMVNAGMMNAPTMVPEPKAEGGPVTAGMPYKVGERGQEWFVPSSDGSIINRRQMAGMGGVNIGTLVLNGIQDPQAMFDAIQRVAKQRSFA